MGSDKALLNLKGIPLILRTAAVVAEVCGSVTLVGNPAKYNTLGLPIVADEFPDEGPVAGMEAALRSTTADWNLIVACDMPALDASVLNSLFIGDGDCVIPRYPNGKTEPLCSVFHRRCHAHIRHCIENGIRRVVDATAGLAIRYVPVTGTEAFTNLNTPEDVRRYGNERSDG